MNNHDDVIDVSGWIGSYPFRGIINSGLEDLKANCLKLSIRKVIVSSFENLFQENGLDAYGMWQEKIETMDALEHWPVVNPSMPGELQLLSKLVDRFHPRGLRLLPNYHNYSLLDGSVEDLMRFSEEHQLIVQVFQRIADERFHWMLHVPAVDETELKNFADKYRRQPIIISAMNNPAILSEQFKYHERLYVDTSRIRGPVFAFEELVKNIPAEKFLFGSLWPIQIVQATLWQIQQSSIPASVRHRILNGNFSSLMQDVSSQSS